MLKSAAIANASFTASAPVPKTSVIIPVYNTQEYLPACLDSVLAQTQQEIEVILVDDGSTDGSLEIERSYEDRDPRVRVIQQPNLRQGAARNRGLLEARGEYVYFMDSDDWIVPEHFETCYRVCKEFDLDFVTFETAGFVDDPNVVRPELFRDFRDRRGIIDEDVIDGVSFWNRYFPEGMIGFLCWLEYFDRSFLIENNLTFVEGIYFEDNDWIVRIFMAAKRMKFVPLRLHRYRSRSGSNVRSGFTHVLADSSFDVHAILCSLARAEHDRAHLMMIQNVSGVKDCRFREFSGLEPTEYLRELTSCFVRFLCEECARDDLPDAVRSMHLSAVINLADGVAVWPNSPVVLTKDLVKSLIHCNVPIIESASRIGFYGTGMACKGFLKVFDTKGRSCFFLETDAAPGKTFCGKPVIGIADAASLNLDVVIITAAKYAEEMKANVARYLGAEMQTYTVPRCVYLLNKFRVGVHLSHPRLYKAGKQAIRAVRKIKKRIRR